jgi:hypothetical protein
MSSTKEQQSKEADLYEGAHDAGPPVRRVRTFHRMSTTLCRDATAVVSQIARTART